MVTLLTCPLCRADLERLAGTGEKVEAEQQVCPSCNAELSPYLGLKSRAEDYCALAQDLLSRGEVAQAQTLIDNLPKVIGESELQLASLKAKLALVKGEVALAHQYAEECDQSERDQLLAALNNLEKNHRACEEQFNYALSAAHAGQYGLASKWLVSASDLAPDNHAVWQLKLKVDLLAKNYLACYQDLRELDRLNSRPPEFIGLEQLLPPLA